MCYSLVSLCLVSKRYLKVFLAYTHILLSALFHKPSVCHNYSNNSKSTFFVQNTEGVEMCLVV